MTKRCPAWIDHQGGTNDDRERSKVNTLPYYTADGNQINHLLQEVSKQEYDLMKSFIDSFKAYEGVFFAFRNYERAKVDYQIFKDNLNTTYAYSTLEEIQWNAMYPITAAIIFLNTFLDNTKNFNSSLQSSKVKASLDELYLTEDIKILRVVRNYSMHASVPVKGTVKTIDLMNEISAYDFYIEKNIIVKSIANPRDIKCLDQFNSTTIKLNLMLESVSVQINKLAEVALQEFIEHIPVHTKIVLLKRTGSLLLGGSQFFVNVFAKCKNVGTVADKNCYVSEETIYFNSDVLKAVRNQMIAANK